MYNSYSQRQYNKRKQEGKIQSYYYNNPEVRFKLLKHSSESRSLVFSLKLDDFQLLLQQKECYYCGKSFNRNIPSDRLSIDRLNNLQGYLKENTVACCYRCNRIKSNEFNESQMLQIGTLIREWRSNGHKC